MAIHWQLKTFLARKHAIFKAVDLQKKIIAETGIQISLQNICNLLSKKPSQIRLKTMEVLCTALDCKLDDFCEVKPGKIHSPHVKKLSPQNAPVRHLVKRDFPDPKSYQ